jgi:hypothetical protein
MTSKIYLTGMAVVASLLIMWGIGCASSSGYKNPDVEITKQRTMGTPDELSPPAPPGACQVKKVGNRWTCELNGRVMVYNDAASKWEPQQR